MVNWQDKGNAERLLSAIIASHDNKINCREVARLFGDGATYDAIENYLRKPKKQALALKKEADGLPASAPATPTAKRTKNTTSSPIKTRKSCTVKGARVSKVKKTITPKFKAELLDEDSMLLDTASSGIASDEADDKV